MSIPEKWRVSEDDEAMADQAAEFDMEDFKERVMERTTEFDRKNFPSENWANHCW